MASYKGKNRKHGVGAEQNGPSEDRHTDPRDESYRPPPPPPPPRQEPTTPFAERVVVNLRDNKPLVDRTLNTVIRKVMGNINETSASEILAGLNQVETTTVADRTGSQSEFSAFSLGATSTAGQSVAQMSLFERAFAALSDAERRLGALKPMQTPDDPENLDALRAITLATYRRLVREFGRSGGPRDQRVERYLDVLLRGNPSADPAEPSLLEKIEEQFKINSGVNTAEDNANVANFRIVNDNLFEVQRSWEAFIKDRVDDYGAHSAKFSRLLIMIQDDVADVESVMDEVNFDEEDRDTQPIEETQPVKDETITIQGLLSWISEFAAEEGPEMVDRGGALGIAATHTQLVMLEELVDTLMDLEEVHVKDKKVQESLDILRYHLEKAASLAEIVKNKTVKDAN